MARTRLLDSWHRSRRERTRMPWGRRVASMEHQLGADMTPGRHARWERLDLDGPDLKAQAGQDTEPEVSEHQADADQHETKQQPAPEQQHDPDHEPEDVEEVDQSEGEQQYRQAQEPDLERDGFAEYEAAQEREEVAEQERVAAIAAEMSLEQARSIVSDPMWHDERYDGAGDFGGLQAARAVCERHGVDHQAMSRVLEDYLDFDLGDPYSDDVQAEVHAAGQPREPEPELEDDEVEP